MRRRVWRGMDWTSAAALATSSKATTSARIASGTAAIGNVRSGIMLEYAANTNTVGGTSAGLRNIISGNGTQAIGIWQSSGNIIQGNFIGTQHNGSGSLGNGGTGIHIYNGSGNSIGGATAAAANVIAFNGARGPSYGGYGVAIAEESGASVGNLIRRNSIFSNGLLGIHLFNWGCFFCAPYNDPGDADSGPNNLQNFPVLAGASSSGGSIAITGTLNSTPNAAFTLDFYASPALDESGFGQGKNVPWLDGPDDRCGGQ